MSTVLLLVPVLPLLAALIVVVGRVAIVRHTGPRSRPGRSARPFAAPLRPSISSRRKDPSRSASTIRPRWLHSPCRLASTSTDLSAVMMVLISGVGTVIYTYSIGYMYQDPHERRYLTLIGVTRLCTALHGLQRQPHDAVPVLADSVSYLLYLLAHNHSHAATLEGAFQNLYAPAGRRCGLSLRHRPRLFALRHVGISRHCSPRQAESTVTLSPLPGIEISGTTAVTLLLFDRRHE